MAALIALLWISLSDFSYASMTFVWVPLGWFGFRGAQQRSRSLLLAHTVSHSFFLSFTLTVSSSMVYALSLGGDHTGVAVMTAVLALIFAVSVVVSVALAASLHCKLLNAFSALALSASTSTESNAALSASALATCNRFRAWSLRMMPPLRPIRRSGIRLGLVVSTLLLLVVSVIDWLAPTRFDLFNSSALLGLLGGWLQIDSLLLVYLAMSVAMLLQGVFQSTIVIIGLPQLVLLALSVVMASRYRVVLQSSDSDTALSHQYATVLDQEEDDDNNNSSNSTAAAAASLAKHTDQEADQGAAVPLTQLSVSDVDPFSQQAS